MRRVRFTPGAKADLVEIVEYIAAGDAARARGFIAALEARTALLCEHPHQGRPAPVLGDDVRLLPFRSYVILYRVTDSLVLVDRVIHAARDIPTLLGGSDDAER